MLLSKIFGVDWIRCRRLVSISAQITIIFIKVSTAIKYGVRAYEKKPATKFHSQHQELMAGTLRLADIAREAKRNSRVLILLRQKTWSAA